MAPLTPTRLIERPLLAPRVAQPAIVSPAAPRLPAERPPGLPDAPAVGGGVAAVVAAPADDLAAALLAARPGGNPLAPAPAALANTATHDFSQYRLLLQPATALHAGIDTSAVDPVELATYIDFTDRVRVVIQTIVNAELDDSEVVDGERLRRAHIVDRMTGAFAAGIGARVYEAYRTIGAEQGLGPVMIVLSDVLRHEFGGFLDKDWHDLLEPDGWVELLPRINNALAKAIAVSQGPAPAVTSYTFEPFPGGSVNFGVRLVYRQTWTPLGTQAGEIVRTIPLGPKQTEKLQIKVVRRNQLTRTVETSTATETDTETTTTTKDSSEVVSEASESFKWHAEAEATGNMGYGSAKVSGGASGETASSSKETKSRLNEAMAKTSSRMRSESKVVVSTQTEVTTEQTSTSEITNPNEELAVTYVYSRLQRQYEINTRMAEVASVVFVAETVPKPEEIDPEWVRRHDWIIARALLDPSFAEDLALIRTTLDTNDQQTDTEIRQFMVASRTNVGLFAGMPGKADHLRTSQEAYEREVERRRAAVKRQREHAARFKRFAQHLADNILHYCRAIWSAEDPDMRQMRYAKIQVPVRWDTATTPGGAAGEASATIVPGPENALEVRPLSEIIEPAGPVGFVGNYAVYFLKEDPEIAQLNAPLALLKLNYSQTDVNATTRVQPAPVTVSDVVVRDTRARSYVMTWNQDDARWTITGDFDGVAAPTPQGIVEFDNLRIRFEQEAIPDGTVVDVRVSTNAFVEDPEYRELRWNNLMPRAAEAGALIFPRLAEMSELVPELAPLVGRANWGALTPEQQALARAAYPRYLFLRDHTRRIVLDTNNLLVDLVLGSTPSLEEFKRLHRYLDVQQAYEQKERLRLDNVRRQRLIDNRRYGDPDVEKVTVVAANAGQVGPAIAVDAAEDGAGAAAPGDGLPPNGPVG